MGKLLTLDLIEQALELNDRKRIVVHGTNEGVSEVFSEEGRIVLSKPQIPPPFNIMTQMVS